MRPPDERQPDDADDEALGTDVPTDAAGQKTYSNLKGRYVAWRNRAMKHEAKISGLELKIVFALIRYVTMDESAARYAKEGRLIVWPSQDRLADDLGVSRQGIQQAIIRLVKRGLLRITKIGRKGRNHRHEYELVMVKIQPSLIVDKTQAPLRFNNQEENASKGERKRKRHCVNLSLIKKEKASAKARSASPLEGSAPHALAHDELSPATIVESLLGDLKLGRELTKARIWFQDELEALQPKAETILEFSSPEFLVLLIAAFKHGAGAAAALKELLPDDDELPNDAKPPARMALLGKQIINAFPGAAETDAELAEDVRDRLREIVRKRERKATRDDYE